MKLVQFKSEYRLNKYSKIYRRIYIESDEIGAIAVTKENSEKIICRSFLPSQIEENTFGIREGCLFSENDTSFNLDDPNALELIKNNFLNYAGNPFFKEECKIYFEMAKKLRQAYENHFYKIKGIPSIYSISSFTSKLFEIRREIERINSIYEELASDSSISVYKELVSDSSIPVPEIIEAFEPKASTSQTKKMLICTDAGFFKNITTGMIYEIVKADSSYYKIKDDFGVEREFKKNRFKEIEVEEMA